MIAKIGNDYNVTTNMTSYLSTGASNRVTKSERDKEHADTIIQSSDINKTKRCAKRFKITRLWLRQTQKMTLPKILQ